MTKSQTDREIQMIDNLVLGLIILIIVSPLAVSFISIEIFDLDKVLTVVIWLGMLGILNALIFYFRDYESRVNCGINKHV